MAVPDSGRPRAHGRPRAVSVLAQNAGPVVPLITSPCRLRGWSLQADFAPNVTIEASAAFAAAAAGTLTLTGFNAVSSVTVTPAAAWPAGLNQITVTNLTGGTQTVDIPGGTEVPVTFTFLPSSGTAGTPVVSVPAMAGGPAYSIEASGLTISPGTIYLSASAELLDGGQVLGVIAAPVPLTNTQWFGDDGIYVGTGIALHVFTGQMYGVIYISDDWHGGTN